MVGLCFDIDYPVAADFSYVNKYLGAAGAENQIISVINDVNSDYDTDYFADQGTFILPGTFFVTTSSADDPWTSSTDPGVLLPDYRTWGNNYWSSQGINNDVSSLWTDRDFAGTTIGLAYVGVVCGNSRYNVLEDFSSNANSIRVLTSHELGHNFSSNHDASGSPHIMAPAVQNTTSWSAQSITSIDAHIASRTCLTACAAAGTPTIEFALSSSAVDEQAISGSTGSCDFDFIDHQVSLGLSIQPETVINVTVSASGGSATLGEDYSLETTSLTFGPGQATNRVIDLKIFEDHKEELDETIVLTFIVTSGVADLGTQLSHTITIENDEDGTTTGAGAGDVLYGNYNFNAATVFIGATSDGRSRALYSKADLNAAGIFAGNISSLSLFVANKQSTGAFNSFRIGLTTTAQDELSSLGWIATTEVYQSNYSTIAGENTFDFTAPFYWDGNSNLYIQWCFDNTSTSADDVLQHTIPLVGTSGHLTHFQALSNTNGCTSTQGGYTFYNTPIQPRIRFGVDGIGTLAETQVNSSAQTILKQGEIANCFSSDFELIATIENTGAADIGCIDISVVTEGIGKSNFLRGRKVELYFCDTCTTSCSKVEDLSEENHKYLTKAHSMALIISL